MAQLLKALNDKIQSGLNCPEIDMNGCDSLLRIANLGSAVQAGDEARKELNLVIKDEAPSELLDQVIAGMEMGLSLSAYYTTAGIEADFQFDLDYFRLPAKGDWNYETWKARKKAARQAHKDQYCSEEQVLDTFETISQGMANGTIEATKNSVRSTKSGKTVYEVKAETQGLTRKSGGASIESLKAKIAAKKATLENN